MAKKNYLATYFELKIIGHKHSTKYLKNREGLILERPAWGANAGGRLKAKTQN